MSKRVRAEIYGRIALMTCAVVWWGMLTWYMVQSRVPSVLLFAHLCLGLVVFYFVVKRDFYLYFLGEVAFPCESLTEKTPENAEFTVHVQGLPPNVNVVYWAAEPDTTVDVAQDPWMAYKKFANAGVTRSNPDGSADLSVRNPVAYKAGGRVLPRHVHFRFCTDSGFMSRVETVEV
jgi:hypothetical protein